MTLRIDNMAAAAQPGFLFLALLGFLYGPLLQACRCIVMCTAPCPCARPSSSAAALMAHLPAEHPRDSQQCLYSQQCHYLDRCLVTPARRAASRPCSVRSGAWPLECKGGTVQLHPPRHCCSGGSPSKRLPAAAAVPGRPEAMQLLAAAPLQMYSTCTSCGAGAALGNISLIPSAASLAETASRRLPQHPPSLEIPPLPTSHLPTQDRIRGLPWQGETSRTKSRCLQLLPRTRQRQRHHPRCCPLAGAPCQSLPGRQQRRPATGS